MVYLSGSDDKNHVKGLQLAIKGASKANPGTEVALRNMLGKFLKKRYEEAQAAAAQAAKS